MSSTVDPAHSGRTQGGRPRVVLVGPPGAGKSTIGRRLAAALDVGVYDTDAAVEVETGRTISEIFATDGEAAFREIEERVVIDALRTQSGVVSLGGGAVLSQRTRAALRGLDVVYLEISIGEGLRRTGSHLTRPLLAGTDPRTAYRDLMRRRRPIYRGVSTIRVRTDGRSPARVVAHILSTLDPTNPAVAAAAARTRARTSTSKDRSGVDATGADRAEAPTSARRARRRSGRTRHRRTAPVIDTAAGPAPGPASPAPADAPGADPPPAGELPTDLPHGDRSAQVQVPLPGPPRGLRRRPST